MTRVARQRPATPHPARGSSPSTSHPTLRKAFDHPLVGVVTVNCDVLDITDRDQQVVIYTAEPGSPSEDALRLLSVVGTQRMDVPG